MRIIAGEARGRKLFPPRDLATRPLLDRIRESLFSSMTDLAGKGVLDLFAGVGSFGLEALSRGAKQATFVELNPGALRILERNIAALSFQSRSTTLRGDALTQPALASVTAPFSVVFLDPPFRMFDRAADVERLFQRARELLESPVLTPGAILLLRHPSKVAISYPFPPGASRRYGESQVIWYEKQR
jgi:16S rRNA (guanine966-N2)-methyltransferase